MNALRLLLALTIGSGGSLSAIEDDRADIGAPPAGAVGEVEAPGPPTGPRGPIEFFSAGIDGVWLPESDSRGSGGDGGLSEDRVALELGWNRIDAPNHFSRVEFTYAFRNYDVTGDSLYAGSFNNVNALRLQTTFERPIGGKWSGFLWSGVSVQAAEGADLLDGWNIPFAAGVGYMFSEKLVVIGGALGILEAETDGLVIPLVALRWRPNDRFSLMTLNGFLASYKMGSRKVWTLSGSLLYQTFVFAVQDLEDFGPVSGVVSQEYWLARLGVERSFGRSFEIGVSVEGRFNRKFEYFDDGDEFAGFDVDSAAGLRFNATYRF